jgi:hypothetical protein
MAYNLILVVEKDFGSPVFAMCWFTDCYTNQGHCTHECIVKSIIDCSGKIYAHVKPMSLRISFWLKWVTCGVKACLLALMIMRSVV